MTVRPNFPGTDEQLWRHLNQRVNAKPPVSMTVIADELGVHVDELCAWIIAYTAPKRVRRAPKYGPPALVSDNMVTTHWPMSRDAQRFANWRKATEAARQARMATK